jgi:hypothetical protein
MRVGGVEVGRLRLRLPSAGSAGAIRLYVRMREDRMRGRSSDREEDLATHRLDTVVSPFVVGVLAFGATGLWWLRPHH